MFFHPADGEFPQIIDLIRRLCRTWLLLCRATAIAVNDLTRYHMDGFLIDLGPFTVTRVLDLLGTFAFAISGIRWASRKNFDWFGAYVVGLVTAIGGGTTRDLLLDVTPFWMEDAQYLVVTGVALLIVILFKNRLFRLGTTLFLFDAIGLGLFTVTGINRSLEMGMPIWVCIMMGTVSGSVGGVIRDMLINEVPVLFKQDLYAIASLLGGAVYFAALQFDPMTPFHAIVGALTVILVRVVSVVFNLELPKLKSKIGKDDP